MTDPDFTPEILNTIANVLPAEADTVQIAALFCTIMDIYSVPERSRLRIAAILTDASGTNYRN